MREKNVGGFGGHTKCIPHWIYATDRKKTETYIFLAPSKFGDALPFSYPPHPNTGGREKRDGSNQILSPPKNDKSNVFHTSAAPNLA